MNRVRAFFDKILYAGLKSGKPNAPARSMRGLSPLSGPLDRFLSGQGHSDPLYLSNRSPARKALLRSLVILPCALFVTGVYLAATGYFSTPPPPPASIDPNRAELAAKILPTLKDARIEAVQSVSVVNAKVTGGPNAVLTGILKNNARHALRSIEVVFELMDARGAQLGAVTVRVQKLESEEIAKFRLPIQQPKAAIALVREVRTN